MAAPLLQVRNLTTRFQTPGGVVQAVRDVSFHVERGETVAVVGESGCGKSVTALSLLRLISDPPGRIVAGEVLFEGADVLTMAERDLRHLRGGRAAMVFQDPFSSLNPTMRLGDQVAEAVRAHSRLDRGQAGERVLELFRAVRIPDPETRVRQYPHEVSGGQRQRVMIAMAFAADPALIIADEPTTALDVTVQAQIVALMQDFCRRTHAAVLLITHDLALVAEMCDRVLVMYAGQIVEEGSAEQVLLEPRHPYTVCLRDALPRLDAEPGARLRAIPGQPPDLANLPSGCPFADRCPRVEAACRQAEPERTEIAQGRFVRCHVAARSSGGTECA